MRTRTREGLAQYTVETKTSYSIIALQAGLIGVSAAVWTSLATRYAIAVAVGCVVLAALLRPVRKESVLAIKGMGVQISHSGHLRKIGDSCLFIPYHDVLDILINEVFIGLQVLPVIQIVRKDSADLVLAFQSLTPPLADLEIVWRGLHKALIEDPVI